MSAVTERRYAMTRIARGDYLLPSNDAQTLWRIFEYVEDGTADVSADGKTWFKLTGRYWATAKYRLPLHDNLDPDDLLDWENWEHWDTTLPTRREAIAAALRG